MLSLQHNFCGYSLGVKLSDASKKLGKKFASGASVVKVHQIFAQLHDESSIGHNILIYLTNWLQGPTEKEHIDVQGDIAYDIVEFITDTWPDVS